MAVVQQGRIQHPGQLIARLATCANTMTALVAAGHLPKEMVRLRGLQSLHLNLRQCLCQSGLPQRSCIHMPQCHSVTVQLHSVERAGGQCRRGWKPLGPRPELEGEEPGHQEVEKFQCR